MGFILYIIAKIIKMAVSPIAHIYSFFKLNKDKHNLYLMEMAIAEDCYGNVLLAPLLNNFAITKIGYPFGNRKETISSVIGKNKRDNTLKVLGKFIDSILEILDKNHSIESINNSIDARIDNKLKD